MWTETGRDYRYALTLKAIRQDLQLTRRYSLVLVQLEHGPNRHLVACVSELVRIVLRSSFDDRMLLFRNLRKNLAYTFLLNREQVASPRGFEPRLPP